MTQHALKNIQLAFVGAGAMGEAMIGGLLAQHDLDPKQIVASDRHDERLRAVGDRFGIDTTFDNRAAVKRAHVVILAVKPQVLPAVFTELQGRIKKGALVVSIVAGTTIESIGSGLAHPAIVRTMPNTPSQVGEGMTVWAATPEVSAAQRSQATAIVAALGPQVFVEDEKFLDMATAISGSGPAYVFLFMEALMDAAVHLGFSRADARKLVIQTVKGTAIFAEQSTVHPAEMRNMVTSPGGTSADALYQLEKGAFRTVVSKAVRACYDRSVALGAIGAEQTRAAQTATPKTRPPRKTSRS